MNTRTAINRTECIFINCYPYGEADLIVRVLTPDMGKMSLIAKHARKSSRRFGSRLDLFDRGTIEYSPSRGSLSILKSFAPARSWQRLRTDPARLVYASIMCESCDFLLVESQENAGDIFNLVETSLDAIERIETAKDCEHMITKSLQRLISIAGFGHSEPELGPEGPALNTIMGMVENIAEKKLKSRAMRDDLLPLNGGKIHN